MTDARRHLQALATGDEDAAFAAAEALIPQMAAALRRGDEVDEDTLLALGVRRGSRADDLDARLLAWAATLSVEEVNLTCTFAAGLWKVRRAEPSPTALAAARALAARSDLDAQAAYAAGNLLCEALPKLGAMASEVRDAIHAAAAHPDLPPSMAQALLRRAS